MSSRQEIERLERQVQKSKKLVHQSELKVEELEASIKGIYDFKSRTFLFNRNKSGVTNAKAVPGNPPDSLKSFLKAA
jgi:hypothetical protein